MDVSCSDLRITIPPGKPDHPGPGRQTGNCSIGSEVPAAAAKTQSASRSSTVRMSRLASPRPIRNATTCPKGQKKISRQRRLQALLYLAFLCAWFSLKPATVLHSASGN
jgi:hypothetical protein